MKKIGDEMKTEDRIRNRVSYRHFKELFKEFRSLGLTKRNAVKSLNLVHKEIDERRGFYSETKSFYAEESIQQLAKDCGC